MTRGFILRMVGRELDRQKGKLLLISLCLSLGFAAFAATYGFSARVLGAIHSESRGILGGDAALNATGLMPGDMEAKVRALPEVDRVCLVYDFATMASVEGLPPKLVEVRAAGPGYPLAGALDISGGHILDHGVFVEAILAQSFNLIVTENLGMENHRPTTLKIGTSDLPVRGIVAKDESRQASAFTLGPRVHMELDTAQSLGLLTQRSRMTGRLLMTLKPGAKIGNLLPKLRDLARNAGPAVRAQSHEEASGALARPIRNLNRFIQQLGLFTLLLALLGAWAILAAFLDGRRRDAAILRCLGAPPNAPILIFGCLTLILLGGALVLGFSLGMAASAFIPRLLGDIIPIAAQNAPAQGPPLIETVAALVMVLLPSLPPLLRLGKVSPLDLLRESAAETGDTTLSWICGASALLVAAWLVLRNASSFKAGLATIAGLALLFFLLMGTTRLLLWFYGRFAVRMPLALKLGFAQLGAKPALTSLMMAVMGLAIFLTLATSFIKDDLVGPILKQRGAGNRPNLFFLDVQPDQSVALQTQLKRFSGRDPLVAPLVRARLKAINGHNLAEAPLMADSGEEESRRVGFRTREQNLTYRSALEEGETVVSGRFWNNPKAPLAEISLEESFAQSIQAKLGDALTFDVQGQEVTGKVTSLRKVVWQTMRPNFFIVMHPSLLEGAPRLDLVALEAESGDARARIQTEVTRSFPNITVIDITEVARKVERILDLISTVGRALATLMLASSLLVLAASQLAGRLGRQRDLALLRTLGAPYRTLLGSLLWEFLLLGSSAALIAGVMARVLSDLYAKKILELPATSNPWAAPVLLLAAALLTAAVGLLGSWRALNTKPLDVLRSE
jgi:putative ABC transport system permease protein